MKKELGTGSQPTGDDDVTRRLKTQRTLSTIVLVVGLIMMIGMITFEDEPGGIPVLLVVCAACWNLITRRRMRTAAGTVATDELDVAG